VKKRSLPKEIVEQWPEIFRDIDVKAVPIEYLDSMRIHFEDGNIWYFRITSQVRKEGIDELKTNLEELIETYKDTIEHIDFRLDVAKFKKDIVKKTNSFLKKTKSKK